MSMSSITTRMDAGLKEQFTKLMSDLGLDMSTYIIMAVKQAVREQGIPFKVTLDVPNKETIQAMRDVGKGTGLSREFHSVEELMDDLNPSVAEPVSGDTVSEKKGIKIGLFKGTPYLLNGHDFDESNEEIAELFGVED